MKTINRRVVAGFAAALLFAAPLATNTQALADTASPAGDQAPLLACTEGGGVFVVVTMEDGSTTAACVDSPQSGTSALSDAGNFITRDSSNMICAINNYPNPCPATFNGKYWQYYQASGADAAAGKWTYATAGSDDTKPQAGWVEGWCYGETCLPEYPGLIAGIATTPGEVIVTPVNTGTTSAGQVQPTSPSLTKWIIGGGMVVVIIIAVVGIVLARRNRSGDHAA